MTGFPTEMTEHIEKFTIFAIIFYVGGSVNPVIFVGGACLKKNLKTIFSYQTDGIFQLTENQYMRELYFAYENCPVSTNYKGYMGKVNGEWVITTHISQDTRNEDGSPKPYSVSCYKIPSQYWDVLSEYFS